VTEIFNSEVCGRFSRHSVFVSFCLHFRISLIATDVHFAKADFFQGELQVVRRKGNCY